uniref:Tudor domain-containing protein n=1 Tax=Seriola dumerili TaxID=41447 RepID=A0A3B4TR61_SERDU
ILDGTGTCSSDSKLINETFRNFYTKLYQSEQVSDAKTLMEAFFSELDLPTISQDQKSELNAPISAAELPKIFNPGEEVLARWSDNKFYSATVDFIGTPLHHYAPTLSPVTHRSSLLQYPKHH